MDEFVAIMVFFSPRCLQTLCIPVITTNVHHLRCDIHRFIEGTISGRHKAWPWWKEGCGNADREALQSTADDSELSRLVPVKWQNKLVARNTAHLGLFKDDKLIQTANL